MTRVFGFMANEFGVLTNHLPGILMALLALGLIIMWHELGHWITAQRLNFKTPRFSVGVAGPTLFWFTWRRTLFVFKPLLIAGYVKILGLVPVEGSNRRAPAAWKRLTVMSAGIVMNLLGALIIYFALAAFVGVPRQDVQIAKIIAGSPAQKAGVASGDILLFVNDQKVTSPEQALELIQLSPKNIVLVLDHHTNTTSLRFDKDDQNHVGAMLASVGEMHYQRLSIPEALWISGNKTASEFVFQAKGVLSLIGFNTLPKALDVSVSGPIGIVENLSDGWNYGLYTFLLLIAQLHIAFAFFNLLPIPPLDGGRMALVLFETVTGHPFKAIYEKRLIMVGLSLALLLFLFGSFNDIRRIFGI